MGKNSSGFLPCVLLAIWGLAVVEGHRLLPSEQVDRKDDKRFSTGCFWRSPTEGISSFSFHLSQRHPSAA